MATPTATPDGPKFLRMAPPYLPSELPFHPSLKPSPPPPSSPATTTEDEHPELSTFLHSLLTEAVTFSDEYIPAKFTCKARAKPSPPATAKVELLAHTRHPFSPFPSPFTASSSSPTRAATAATRQETWFARRSRHVDRTEQGTASWREFEEGLHGWDHSRREKEYTPSVVDAREVCAWSAEDIAAAISTAAATATAEGTAGVTFSDVTLAVYEMCHRLPFPLHPRVFSVVVATARTHSPSPSSTTSSSSFIVAQIPISLTNIPAAFYSNNRYKQPDQKSSEIHNPIGNSNGTVVMGLYTSVERCKRLPASVPAEGEGAAVTEGKGEGQAETETEWLMATASDAGGILPGWAQKLGTPGAVVKDVGLFVTWAEGRRG